MRHKDRKDERRCFCILWRWLMHVPLTGDELDRMQNPSDPPDFIIDRTDHKIAVEHTHVLRTDPPASIDPKLLLRSSVIEKRICDQVNVLLRRDMSRSPAVFVTISFATCDKVRNSAKAANEIAEGIVDLVQRHLASDALPLSIDAQELSAINQCLAAVRVNTKIGGGSSSVGRCTYCRVEEWGLSDFERVAHAKECAFSRYKGDFAERWLLLGVGGDHKAQAFEPSDEACREGITTTFNRIFVVDDQVEKVWELRAKPSH